MDLHPLALSVKLYSLTDEIISLLLMIAMIWFAVDVWADCVMRGKMVGRTRRPRESVHFRRLASREISSRDRDHGDYTLLLRLCYWCRWTDDETADGATGLIGNHRLLDAREAMGASSYWTEGPEEQLRSDHSSRKPVDWILQNWKADNRWLC